MRALDKKLLRDFARLWVQALSIALVLGSGVAILLISFGMYGALENTREAYYERNRFADVFAGVKRAPRSLERDIVAIDGVWAVELRTVAEAILDLPFRPEASVGRFVSIPAGDGARLNVPLLRSGQFPDPQSSNEVLVNEPFALANGFETGDTIRANLNGRRRELTITGTALSPEYIYTIGPGQLLPDNETFGILWMPQPAVEAAFDTVGAFNDVSLKLTRNAKPEEIIERLDDLLEPYGGLGAYERSEQLSHSFIEAELEQLRTMGYILPPIFFAIAAFLVNMVVGRIVALERSQIGLLKATGYSNMEVSLHYLYLAVLIAIVGVFLGWGFGAWAARGLAQIYAQFFTFPYLLYRIPVTAYATSGLLGIAAAAGGAILNAMKAAKLPPAIAMAPPAPPNFRRSALDGVLTTLRLSQPTMMVFRGIVRWPVRAFLTCLGLALAVAVLVASSFFGDSMDEIVDLAFYQSNRQHAVLAFSENAPETALEDVENLPGVLYAEGQLGLPARLVNGHLEKRIGIDARRPDADLSRALDDRGKVIVAPEEGIMLTERLASQLDVLPGDSVEVHFLTGLRETHDLTVTGTVVQFFGLGAYIDATFAARLLRQSPRISSANVLIDARAIDALHARAKETPSLSGLIMFSKMRNAFRDIISENILVTTTVYVVTAVLITAGVTYNGARIQLSERARELASLRILGFTNAEVSYILMGETMLLVLLAQPFGWALGAFLAWAMVTAFSSDLYSIPLVLNRDTFGFASVVALAAAIVSVLAVRRRIDTMNLVSVMKTRE
ncbi:ABC transporter permease [Oricola cellulosilytica]|uniref:FtsX-like permease family protein n=1 Tax=Oricola cellulosilytica TaxID=1429082 RepID=A0A4R0PBS9_9HYPH|nr:ABC transporter permease [Oricola cellulosilytica]TCD13501.1 FtsX-like permease family protein [Oricola cellulosilytica]